MLGTVALDQRVTFGQCVSLFYFLPTSSPGIIATGSADIFPLRMFDYVALDQHTCLKPSSYVCNSFTRLAGMLKYPCLKRCFKPTGMFVAVAPDHLARQLRLNSTSMHVCWSRFSLQKCLNQLQMTNNHICSCVAMLHLPQTRSYVHMLVPN